MSSDGGVGIFFHLPFIPTSLCSALLCFPSLAHTSAPEAARNSSQPTPVRGDGAERRGSCQASLLVS